MTWFLSYNYISNAHPGSSALNKLLHVFYIFCCWRSVQQVSPIAVDGETTPAQVTTEGNPFLDVQILFHVTFFYMD